MNSLGHDYLSDFARHYVAQGRAKGKTEGRSEMLLRLLALRYSCPAERLQTLIHNLRDAQLDTVAERLLTAPTLEEALAPQD
jgi:hypothetical protein